MCCEPSGFREEEIDGTCPECGEDTVGRNDVNAFDCCGYSPVWCDHCGHAPCDDSC